MNGETVIAIEEVLAAAVDTYGGRLEVSRASIEKSYAGKVLAVDFDHLKEVVVITLVESEDVTLDGNE